MPRTLAEVLSSERNHAVGTGWASTCGAPGVPGTGTLNCETLMGQEAVRGVLTTHVSFVQLGRLKLLVAYALVNILPTMPGPLDRRGRESMSQCLWAMEGSVR